MLHEIDAVPMVYIAAKADDPVYEEISVNLNEAVAGELRIDTSLYEGKLFVIGSAEADTFTIHAIAAQTFLDGGAGDDLFYVGEGTVDAIADSLFLQGNDGNDSVVIDSQSSAQNSDVTLEQQTVQQELLEEKLSRVTNALEFTNVTDAENRAIAERLEIISADYLQLAAQRMKTDDLQNIALQMAVNNASIIHAALLEAKADFESAISELIVQQQVLKSTYMRDALKQYYDARLAKDESQARYDSLLVEKDNVAKSELAILIRDLTSSFRSRTGGTLVHPLTAKMILDGYDAANTTVSITADVEINGAVTSETVTVDDGYLYDDEIRALNYIEELKDRSQSILQGIKDGNLREEGAKDLLEPFFNDAQLNTFYADSINGDDWVTPADALITADSSGVLAAIATDRIAASPSQIALESATSAVNALMSASANSDVIGLINSLQSTLATLDDTLLASASSTNAQSSLVRLERLQSAAAVALSAERGLVDAAKLIWSNIPASSAFTAIDNFAAQADITWMRH